MEMEEGKVVVRGRAEIDTRRPFKSVKEALLLFGEKVLAPDLHPHNLLKQMERRERENKQTKVEAKEFQETKQTLEKAKEGEEEGFMAYYLMSLKQELQDTKSQLENLKSKTEPYHHHNYQNQFSPVDKEIEEIKFIENPIKIDPELIENDKYEQENDDDELFEFEKKRSVKFASPPSLIKVLVNKEMQVPKVQDTTNPSSLKKKTLIPSLGRIFSRKKGGQTPTTHKASK